MTQDDAMCSGDPAPATQTAGFKLSAGKIRLDLVPPEVELAIARGLTFGLTKYPARNWEQGLSWSDVYRALKNHMLAWECGVESDEESGLSPLDHACACMAMLRAMVARGVGQDDRPEKAVYDGRLLRFSGKQ